MRKVKVFIQIFIFILAYQTPSIVYSQFNSDEIFLRVDKMPRFEGCESIADEDKAYLCFTEKITDFLIQELKYPDIERLENNEGVVYVSFVVDEMGFAQNVQVVRGASPLFDMEAKRVISKLPPFKPGEMDGKRVKVQYTLPIRFKLN